MRILVIGKNGQLCKSIQNIIMNTEVTNNFVFVGREELELSDKNNLLINTNLIHAAWENEVGRVLNLGSSCIYPRACKQPIKEDRDR